MNMERIFLYDLSGAYLENQWKTHNYLRHILMLWLFALSFFLVALGAGFYKMLAAILESVG